MVSSWLWVGRKRSRKPHDAAKLPKASTWEERLTYGSSWGMTEEQVKRWSKDVEPRKVVEGGSSNTDEVDSGGMYSEGRMDDDRYRRGAGGSDISTLGGGISMVARGSSSWPATYYARMGEAD